MTENFDKSGPEHQPTEPCLHSPPQFGHVQMKYIGDVV